MYQVIIIEDDPMVASINKKYVELNKYLHVAAMFSNGKDALEYLRNNHVDLAIMDVYMPIMDGTELISAIRSENRSIDIIMVTAANDSKHIRHFLSLGILDYLVKPFEYVRFNHALATFIQHREFLAMPNISQMEIDQMVNYSSAPVQAQKSDLLNKGLQKKTLEMILSCMMEKPGIPLTCEHIAASVQLSRVTVRRYLNYLLEQQEIFSDIDYNTGGRPSIIYFSKKS